MEHEQWAVAEFSSGEGAVDRQGPGGKFAGHPSRRLTRRRVLGGGGLGLLVVAGGTGLLYAREPEVPWYVTGGNDKVRAAYAFAAAQPDVLRFVPCFCGCGRSDGHRSVLDCFVAGSDLFGRTRYDDHGAGCDICVAVVFDAEAKFEQGKGLTQIRDEIDAFYAPYARYATDTPRPPHKPD